MSQNPYLLTQLKMPGSSMARIVFPWNHAFTKFETTEFNPVATEGRMTEADLENVLALLSQCSCYQRSLRSRAPTFFYTAILGSILFTLSFIRFNVGLIQLDFNMTYIKYGMVLGFIIMIIGLCGLNVSAKNYNPEREQQFKEVLNKANKEIFESRGIRWTTGTYGAWITIELDYVTRGLYNSTQPTQNDNYGSLGQQRGDGYARAY